MMEFLEGFDAGICPRCLRAMASRCTRPAASVYTGGVECDRCGLELVRHGVDEDDGVEDFFHCGRCWYDLCRNCTLHEMREVWWDDD